MNYSRAIGYARFVLVILCVLLLLSVSVLGYKLGDGNYLDIPGIGNTRVISLGFDLTGGTVVTYTADTDATGTELESIMNSINTKFRARLDLMGLEDAECYLLGDKMITVEIPGTVTRNDASDTFGVKGVVTFLDYNDEVVMTGENIKSATYYPSGTSGSTTTYSIVIEFTPEGRAEFAKVSDVAANQVGDNKVLKIMLDDSQISSTTVSKKIDEDYIVLSSSSGMSEAYARIVSATIAAGALPVELEFSELSPVSSILGDVEVMTIIKIAALAFILVLLLIIVFYKLPGLVVAISFGGFISLFILAMTFLYARLSFGGLAAIFVISLLFINVNIITINRVKSEIASGKSIRSSIKSAFQSVSANMFNAHLILFIASAGMYIWGSASIKSLAMITSIGVVVSYAVSRKLSKWLLNLLCDMNLSTAKLFGAKEGSVE